MAKIIGVDPGLKGGICILLDGKMRGLWPMPTFSVKTSAKKVRNYVDSEGIRNILKDHLDAEVYIEQVRSLYGMSAESNFSMGHGLGVVESTVRIIIGTFYLLKAKDWQADTWIEKDFVLKGNGRKDTKATSLNAALRIFPNQSFLRTARSKVPHDGMVDAALIAYSQFKRE